MKINKAGSITQKILSIALALSLVNLIWFVYFFSKYHYLPTPFVFDKSNSFMDFYNPLFWISKNEFYTTYQSVYPPLNFYILKIFSYLPYANLNFGNPYELRGQNFLLTITLISISSFILFLSVNQKNWKILFSTKERFYLFLIFLFSAPFLFALERGNIILLGLLIFSIYVYSDSIFIKSLLLAILVNFKPYFIVLSLVELKYKNERFKFFIYFLSFSIIIFFGLGYFVKLNYQDFLNNYIEFSKLKISPDGVISLPHSLAAMTMIPQMIAPNSNKFLDINFGHLQYLNLAGTAILSALIAIKKMPRNDAVIGITILLTNCFIGTGGYILLFYIPIIPLLIKKQRYTLLLLLGVIFVAPLDTISIASIPFATRTSYLGGDLFFQNISLDLGIGSILRPMCNFAMLVFFIQYILSQNNKSPHTKEIEKL